MYEVTIDLNSIPPVSNAIPPLERLRMGNSAGKTGSGGSPITSPTMPVSSPNSPQGGTVSPNNINAGGAGSSGTKSTPLTASSQRESLLIKKGHPNILHLFDSLETNQHIYMVLEYCPNGIVPDLMPFFPNRQMPEDMVAFIFHDILKGVEFLHSKSVVHRDLKPDNFLFDRNWNIKVRQNSNMRVSDCFGFLIAKSSLLILVHGPLDGL